MIRHLVIRGLLFVKDVRTTLSFPLSLHDALPILVGNHFRMIQNYLSASACAFCCDMMSSRTFVMSSACACVRTLSSPSAGSRSEEHTSELQSPCNIVCRLLLDKKKMERNRIRKKQ